MSASLRTLRILSRASRLARLQVEEALPALRRAFRDTEFAATALPTVGDRDLRTPLTDPGVPSDFFSRELDEALLRGEADLAVHSAKDLPDPLPEGLVIGALLPARDTRDALVLRAGVDLNQGGVIGTSSPLRETAIRERYPDTVCKAIRGDIGQRLAQLDAGDYDAVLIAGCALQRLGLSDRISQWLDYETTPQQGRLAITLRQDRHDLRHALASIDVRRLAGAVALVGCPADSSLLGPHARQLLAQADLVLHDRLVPADILAELGARAEYVGKRGHAHSTTQAHIHRRILHETEAGRLVVRLHGGDPGVLGHLGETLDFCESWGLRTEVVPAVSAAQLTAARGLCSLTHRTEGRSIRLLSGHLGLADQPLAALDPALGHLAIYMGVRDLEAIQARLLAAGWQADSPVTVGQQLGEADEVVVTHRLQDLHRHPPASPAVLLTGPRPHPRRLTLFTGSDPEKFLPCGPFLHLPLLELVPRPLPERAALLREKLPRWDGLIFASTRAVDFCLEALWVEGDARALAGKKLLAVGPLTAEALRRHGLRADAAPEGLGGAAALAEIPGDWRGTYGYLTSDQSPLAERQQALRARGLILDSAVFYENRARRPSALPSVPFERVLFTSGSTVRAYFDAFPAEMAAERDWLAAGSSTLRALEALGLSGLTISKPISALHAGQPEL